MTIKEKRYERQSKENIRRKKQTNCNIAKEITTWADSSSNGRWRN